VPNQPGVSSPVSYCQNGTAVPLSATGSNLLWYTAATGGTGSVTAPTPSTTTVGSTIYYVSQTTNNCESPRASITVNVTATTPAPTVSTPVNYCINSIASALSATGTNLLWYTAATGGTGTATAPTPSTAAIGVTTYYVSQTLSCGEGPRAAIVVNVYGIPTQPGVTSPVTYCQNATATALTATGNNLLWYTVASGGTGSSTAPTPSTASAGNINYYVSQSTNGCESPRSTIIVTVNGTPALPGVTNPSAYCQNAIATPLSATGSNLLWYAAATGGTGSSTAPTPTTSVGGTFTFYVSQTINNCEGPRASITVTVNALPAAPTVTTPVTYCQNATATALSATGSNLLWYTAATGGTGSSTAPIPSTSAGGSTVYYVSQSNSCGESARAALTVTVTPTPSLSTGLTATGITLNAATLSWTVVPGVFYTVDYKLATAAVWTNVLSASNAGTVALTGLTSSSTYDWRVSANCATTLNSNYATAQFTTTSHNNVIGNIRSGFGIKITPNPVIKQGLVDYIVPGSGTVNISLYGTGGHQLQRLFSAVQTAGQYQLQLPNQLTTLPAGSYILRVEQNGKGNYIQFIKK
jgi:hypothetical protein